MATVTIIKNNKTYTFDPEHLKDPEKMRDFYNLALKNNPDLTYDDFANEYRNLGYEVAEMSATPTKFELFNEHFSLISSELSLKQQNLNLSLQQSMTNSNTSQINTNLLEQPLISEYQTLADGWKETLFHNNQNFSTNNTDILQNSSEIYNLLALLYEPVINTLTIPTKTITNADGTVTQKLDILSPDKLEVPTTIKEALLKAHGFNSDGTEKVPFNSDGKIGLSIHQTGMIMNGIVNSIHPVENTKLSQIANGVLDGISTIGSKIPGIAGAAISGAAQAMKLVGNLASTNVNLFKVDENLAANQEASYGGAFNTMRSQKGGTYDLWSLGEAKKLKKLLQLSKLLQSKIGVINNKALDWFALANDPTYEINREIQLSGGSSNYTIAAKFGAKLEYVRNIINKATAKDIQLPKLTFIEELEIPEIESFKFGGLLITETFIEELQIPTFVEELSIEIFKEGGKTSEELTGDEKLTPKSIQEKIRRKRTGVKAYQEFLQTLPDNLKYTDEKTYRMKDAWILYGRPKDFEEALELGMFGWNEDDLSYHGGTVAFNPITENYEFLKHADHPTTWMETIQYEYGLKAGKLKDGTLEHSNNPSDYELIPLSEEEREFYNDFKKHYRLEKSYPWYLYIRIDPDEEFEEIPISEYKLGGKVNVIPDGALHARLHHMEDDENITKKGIPVVSETEDGIEQQAEIELNEIIFRLEVTKRLEDLQKEYYNDNTSLKRKDELAIEAGKILTYEILYNTQDNTNLINEIK